MRTKICIVLLLFISIMMGCSTPKDYKYAFDFKQSKALSLYFDSYDEKDVRFFPMKIDDNLFYFTIHDMNLKSSIAVCALNLADDSVIELYEVKDPVENVIITDYLNKDATEYLATIKSPTSDSSPNELQVVMFKNDKFVELNKGYTIDKNSRISFTKLKNDIYFVSFNLEKSSDNPLYIKQSYSLNRITGSNEIVQMDYGRMTIQNNEDQEDNEKVLYRQGDFMSYQPKKVNDNTLSYIYAKDNQAHLATVKNRTLKSKKIDNMLLYGMFNGNYIVEKESDDSSLYTYNSETKKDERIYIEPATAYSFNNIDERSLLYTADSSLYMICSKDGKIIIDKVDIPNDLDAVYPFANRSYTVLTDRNFKGMIYFSKNERSFYENE